MKQDNDKELAELLGCLGYSEQQVGEMAEEIKGGEELLRREDKLSVAPAVLERVEAEVRRQLGARRRRRAWLARAAVAAAVLVVVGATWWFSGQEGNGIKPQGQPSPVVRAEEELFGDEMALWEAALVQENYLELDELLLDEVLWLWDEANWDIDKLLGKVRFRTFSC